MEEEYYLKKINGKWIYNKEFLEWLLNNSKKFPGLDPLEKSLHLGRGTLKRIIGKENIKLEYNHQLNKTDVKYKAIYQNYEWCYQKYVIEGKTYDEMAKEANCSKRVIIKWCSERHNLNTHTIKKFMILNNEQKNLVIGSLLGDGHIDKREGQSMFIVSHAENQKDYLYWKYNIFKDYCNKEPRFIKGLLREKNGKCYTCQNQYRFITKIIDDLDKYKKMSKKELISELNEFSLCIYLLDDGFRSESNWSLCIASLNEKEKEYLINTLKDKFKLEAHLEKDVRYLLFNSTSSRKIDTLILKYIPNELDIIKYKILDKKITKPNNYIYIISENDKKGLSQVLKNKKNYNNFREIIMSKGIKEISNSELKEKWEELYNEKI